MKSFEADEYWKVVYVASRQEKKLANRLAQLQIEYYLPMSKKLRIWSDRKKWIDFPMFNGYLFVRPYRHQFDLVVSQPGAVNYLYFNKSHAKVTDHEIEIIKSIEESGYYAESIHTPAEFEEGESVMVSEGPLKGQLGTLVRKNNERIFLVALHGIGQSLLVNIPFDLLVKQDLIA